ncbi:Gtr1/RagA G protein conserved region-domain-containing protein [Papiliotrema laurentii]|uniref:GTP-binding protein n=1 Tax=Papiliotrema laurentii TaxID=5418 RepID=A0AAD9FWP2_PAPLA|nr:Gtr1/RagA G protein conserved region-domain-containing protein [Papiliotrema laurentii]
MPVPQPSTQGESSKGPKTPQLGNQEDDTNRQKILVLGWRKAGKSSCIKTIFQDVPVTDVPYFDSTQKVEKVLYDTIVPLEIWDTPSNFDTDSPDVRLGSFATIIYVMDMQQDDSYHEAILPFVKVMIRAHLANPNMKFAVFIHKAEVLSEDYRGENYAEIQRAMAEELEDFPYNSVQQYAPNVNFSDPSVTANIIGQLQNEVRFDMTSVHDTTLRDAWSKVIQGVMEMLPSVEQLLVNFTGTSGMDNTYLFDIGSKVVVAADNRGRNDATLELVTEYLLRFLQFRELYRVLGKRKDEETDGDAEGSPDGEKAVANGDDVPEEEWDEEGKTGWWDEEDPDAPWMTQSTRLMPNTTIALWQFTPYLALIVLLRTDTWVARRGMIEYNLTFLRQGIRRILMEMDG